MINALRTSRAMRIGALSALLAGVIAWWLANRWQLAHVMVPVAIAAHEINAGSVIAPSDVAFREFPLAYLPAQSVDALELLIGRVAIAPLAAEEIFTTTRLASLQQMRSVQPLLQEGERAITINLPAESAVGGYLAPGNAIDLIGSLKSSDTQNTPLVFTLERNVRVLAVNRDTPLTLGTRKSAPVAHGGAAESVMQNAVSHDQLLTLALQPEQVARVLFVADHGRLHAVLRAGSSFDAELPSAPVTATSVVSITNAPMEYHGTNR